MVKPIAKKSRPPYFWWTLAHGLALCFCALSWLITLYIFQNPELPHNYSILRAIHCAPKLPIFTALEAPTGSSMRPELLYRHFAAYAGKENANKLKMLNQHLMRAYIQNYEEAEKPRYLEGDYRVLQTRALTPQDFIYPGIVVRAHALVQPDKLRPPGPYPVLVEYVFPCDQKAALTWFKPGDIMNVQKIPNCATVLHVSHLGTVDEPIVNITVMPLVYGEYRIGEQRVLQLMPPEALNLKGKFPLMQGDLPDLR